MKSFVNTAKIEYIEGERVKTLYSNSVVIPFVHSHQYISGEVYCRKGRRRWSLSVREKNTERCIFSLKGYVSKGFYTQINPDKQYYISFDSNRDSTMRLYNIPDCVTVCYNCE